MIRPRRILFACGLALASLPLIAELTVLAVGVCGPTLLYVTPEVVKDLAEIGQNWCGRGQLPPRVWSTMRGSRVVQFDDPVCAFWGGLTTDVGDWMLATGPSGVALAVSNAWGRSGQMYGGYMRPVIYLPHVVAIPLAAALPLYFVLACRYGPLFWWLPLKRMLTQKPGHCRRCGYNLTGNTSGVRPECGTAVLVQRQT